jgi:hypothetical protein
VCACVRVVVVVVVGGGGVQAAVGGTCQMGVFAFAFLTSKKPLKGW